VRLVCSQSCSEGNSDNEQNLFVYAENMTNLSSSVWFWSLAVIAQP
jgi:hypothetical protein